MTLTVNGDARDVPTGATIDGLLRAVGRDPDVPGVAVAVDDRVVRRADWATTTLLEGQRVELITAAQGG